MHLYFSAVSCAVLLRLNSCFGQISRTTDPSVSGNMIKRKGMLNGRETTVLPVVL